jgi:hypothetical protein
MPNWNNLYIAGCQGVRLLTGYGWVENEHVFQLNMAFEFMAIEATSLEVTR